jgi:hypothetical protein
MSSDSNGLNGNSTSAISPRHMAAIALAEAMNKARLDQTTTDKSRAETRLTAAQRLDTLKAKLQPLYAAIPADVEGFELGTVHADKPRLFLDMLAFVEATPEGFRLIQQTRKGRAVLNDSTSDAGMVESVTAYIARRLVQREQMLSTEEITPAKMEKPADMAGFPPERPNITDTEKPLQADAKVSIDTSPKTALIAEKSAEIPTDTRQPVVDRMSNYRPASELIANDRDASVATAAVGTTGGIRQMPVQRKSSGGWFWMLLAALIGLGAGAAALIFAFEKITL